MRLEANDPFWLVVDPGPESTLADICWQTSLEGLWVQFRGGLTFDGRPTLFTDAEEARAEARMRLSVYANLRKQLGAPSR